MQLLDIFKKAFTGRSGLRARIIMMTGIGFITLFAFFVLSAQREAARKQQPSQPFSSVKAPAGGELDYNIIQLDTIPFSKPLLQQPPAARTTQQVAQKQPDVQPRKTVNKQTPARQTTPAAKSRPSSQTRLPRNSALTQKSNMLVVNNVNKSSSASALSNEYAGLRRVRVKVILPQRTPVATGSLVEARVINEANFGKLVIPRRAQLLGIARLQNNRVHIDFRELSIQEKQYSCSGQAYTLKLLQGIPFNPLGNEAKSVLLDELKSAASGVPLLGRAINRSNYNPLIDEATTLDEGLEFYVLLTNIF